MQLNTSTLLADATPIPAELRLTFEQFQATGIDQADLREFKDCHLCDPDLPGPIPGRSYGHLILTKQEGGLWGCEWGMSYAESALDMAEAALYGVYVSEVADNRVRDYLRDVMPWNYMLAPERDTPEWLGQVLAAWFAFHDRAYRAPETILADPQGTPEDQVAWLRKWVERRDLLQSASVADERQAQADVADARFDHPRLAEWKAAVADGRTLLGLADWIRHNPPAGRA